MQIAIFQHWFRKWLGADQAPSLIGTYDDYFTDAYTRHSASIKLILQDNSNATSVHLINNIFTNPWCTVLDVDIEIWIKIWTLTLLVTKLHTCFDFRYLISNSNAYETKFKLMMCVNLCYANLHYRRYTVWRQFGNFSNKTKYSTLSEIHMIENSIDRMRFL